MAPTRLEHMFEVTTEAGLEPGAGTRTVLDRARAARRAELAAAAELLVVAAAWADQHPVPRNRHPAGGGEVARHRRTSSRCCAFPPHVT